MGDIIHALTQLPFVAGWVTGGCIFFFAGLATGWTRGERTGWHNGWHAARGE